MRARKGGNIGFVSTRIEGTDGVSLEIAKWANVLERNGFSCYYFAGSSDRPASKSFLVKEAHFAHPAVRRISKACFGKRVRSPDATRAVHELRELLKKELYRFAERFSIGLLIVENALAIPMNIPLGLALAEFIAETGMPSIGHHHDFFWERKRFLVNCVEDYLSWAFPPSLKSLVHVVINTIASEQLSYRKGLSNIVIPNVYDFSSPPEPPDDYCTGLRKELGLSPGDLFVLQPTRAVPRKQIERSIELVSRLKLKKPVLVISHSVRDEGTEYSRRLLEYAKAMGVKLVSIENRVGPERGRTPSGRRIYTIGDVYRCADLVTYPSGFEGFGNAFLEAVYYKKPIVVNRYSTYIADIEPKGFDLITLGGFVTEKTLDKVRRVLGDEKKRHRTVELNYRLAARHFSFEVLEKELIPLVERALR